MTGYEIPCYSFDMLDPAFLRCLQDIEVPKTLLSLQTLVNSKAFHVNCNNANLKTGAR